MHLAEKSAKPRSPKLTQRIIDAIEAAGADTPYMTEWARAAGVHARLVMRWAKKGRAEQSGLEWDLAQLIDELDEYWIRVAEEEVRRYGLPELCRYQWDVH